MMTTANTTPITIPAISPPPRADDSGVGVGPKVVGEAVVVEATSVVGASVDGMSFVVAGDVVGVVVVGGGGA